MHELNLAYRLVEFHDAPTQIMFIGHDHPRGWSRISLGYDTVEKLKEDCGVPDEPCRLCGQMFQTDYMDEVKKVLLEKNICFTCDYWERMIARPDQDRCVRIEGRHYTIAEAESGPSMFKGHGGRSFSIEFFDGRSVATNNLWHQGAIPAHFKDKLPDNAKFKQPA